MEENLTDAFIIGKKYRFQFNEVLATDWLYLAAVVPPCWVLAGENLNVSHGSELINLNNVVRVFGWAFNEAVESNE